MTGGAGQVFGDALRWVELSERLRDTEASVHHALGLLCDVDPEVSATASVTLSERQVAAVLADLDAAARTFDLVSLLASTVRAGTFEIRRSALQLEAGAALAAGVASTPRVRLLARCLPAGEGIRALSEMLRCTDSHETWFDVTVGDVLSWFQGTDDRLIRRLTDQARLAPEMCWPRLDRLQVSRLAAALDDHAVQMRSG